METKNMDFSDKKISVVVVTYSKRWFLLEKVLNRILDEKQISEIILVDNASGDKEEIGSFINLNKEKNIKLIRFDKNFGSAKGFSSGIQEARKSNSDYLLLLDDDNLPEVNFVENYFNSLKTISEDLNYVVIAGNRNSLSGNESFFYNPPDPFIKRTFFNIFSFQKLNNFLKLFKKINNKKLIFYPMVRVSSLAYSGSLIPIDLARKAKLPDENLFTYGDDIEYSWNLIDVGAKLYLSSGPVITDIDDTFNGLSYFEGLFSKEMKDFKVYLRIRNSVYLSKKHKAQSKITLFINILFWYVGVNIFMLFKLGVSKQNFKRSGLILKALIDGLRGDLKEFNLN
jgi:GT2 family glycosyltransferase